MTRSAKDICCCILCAVVVMIAIPLIVCGLLGIWLADVLSRRLAKPKSRP